MTTQTLTLEGALQQAVSHHQAGRLQDAERYYRAILQAQPNQPDANHNYGALLLQSKQIPASLLHFKAAVDVMPQQAQFWLSYIDALIGAGHKDKAKEMLKQCRARGFTGDWVDALAQRLDDRSLAPPSGEPSQYVMNSLVVLVDTGRHAEAERIAREMTQKFPKHGFGWKTLGALLQLQHLNNQAVDAMQMAQTLAPDDVEVHCNLGAALQEMGRLDEAVASYRVALKLNPDYAAAHGNLGVTLQDMGKHDEAEVSYRRALELQPNSPKVLNNLGANLRSMGRLEEAIASYRQALVLKPDYAEAYINLSVAQRVSGQLKDAEYSIRQALNIRPGYIEASFSLGHILWRQGHTVEAESVYRAALKENPDHADGHSKLGGILQEMGRLEEALASYRRALEINPDLPIPMNNLATILQDMDRIDEAQAYYIRAIEIEPNFALAHNNLGAIYERSGHTDLAKVSYKKAQELGWVGAHIKSALILPSIMGPCDEVLVSRAAFERNLDLLIEDAIPFNEPLRSGGSTNFYLAYHGLNDRDLQVKVAKYYAQACPSLLYTSPHCRKKKLVLGKKIRIGFISRYLSQHSVSLSFSKILEVVASREQFEVALISSHAIDENIYAGASATRTRLPHNLELAREAVAALELDVLVYLDIGMEPQSYFMAFARLAPVQCVLGGHPVTTGIANMDYYLSSELMESDNAQEHYSEKLIRFPSPVYYFARPNLPERLKTREELGLPNAGHIYMCPMRLQKMHPDFDVAMAELLQLDPAGTIVLFDDMYLPLGKQFLLERFEKTIPQALRERIIFLPWVKDPADFISTIAAADVVLDPYHFGIGTTAIMTFVTGTPLVTKPAEFMRGRVGAAMCKMLDMEECIAADTQEYVRKAYEIASNRQVRERVSAKIMQNSSIFFDNLQPIEHLVDFLSLVRQE